MQTIDKSVALSKGLLPCCIFMSCLGKSGVIFNQSHRKGWRARGDPPLPQPQKTPPPATTGNPASPHLAVNNMHHSLDLVHICLHAAGSGRCVSLCVCVCLCINVRTWFKGRWTNGGATWSDQMFWFLMCIAHQKQQPVPLLGPCYPVRPANPSASSLPDPVHSGSGYFSRAFSVSSLFCIWWERGYQHFCISSTSSAELW